MWVKQRNPRLCRCQVSTVVPVLLLVLAAVLYSCSVSIAPVHASLFQLSTCAPTSTSAVSSSSSTAASPLSPSSEYDFSVDVRAALSASRARSAAARPCSSSAASFGHQIDERTGRLTQLNDSYTSRLRAAMQRRLAATPPYLGADWSAGSQSIVTSFDPQAPHRLAFLLDMLRNVLHCTLPVEVFYYPDEERAVDMYRATLALSTPSMYSSTSASAVRRLDEELHWRPINSSRYYTPGMYGYALKAAAILHSSAQHVLWLDSDNLPLVDPAALFRSAEYVQYGAVFWPDYWPLSSANPVFALLNISCSGAQYYQQESGQLLIDRSRHWRPLHLAHWMNDNSADGGIELYEFLHGDKDTFHLSFAALDHSYFFVRRWLSTVGFSSHFVAGGVCGLAMLQYDTRDQPAFLHVNLVKSMPGHEFDSHPYLTHITHFAADIDNPQLTAELVGLARSEASDSASTTNNSSYGSEYGVCVVLGGGGSGNGSGSAALARLTYELPEPLRQIEHAMRRFDDEVRALHARRQQQQQLQMGATESELS